MTELMGILLIEELLVKRFCLFRQCCSPYLLMKVKEHLATGYATLSVDSLAFQTVRFQFQINNLENVLSLN